MPPISLGTRVFLRFVGPEAYFILRVLLKMNKNTIVEKVTEMHDLVKKLLGLLCQCLGEVLCYAFPVSVLGVLC